MFVSFQVDVGIVQDCVEYVTAGELWIKAISGQYGCFQTMPRMRFVELVQSLENSLGRATSSETEPEVATVETILKIVSSPNVACMTPGAVRTCFVPVKIMVNLVIER